VTEPSASVPVPTPAPPPARRPGGRGARIRTRVLDAVRAHLLAYGYDGLTVDAVAARAGVHRTTVYRRWHDVGGLLADVFDAASGDDWAPADTGSLEGDLTAMNREVHAALTADPSITRALITASFRSEEAALALVRFWEERYERCGAVVARAVRRQEIPAATDGRRLLIAATAPIYHQLVLLRAPADDRLIVSAARAAALAASAGVFALAEGGPPASSEETLRSQRTVDIEVRDDHRGGMSSSADQPTAADQSTEPFTQPPPDEARARRASASLFRIAERHAATAGQRARQSNPVLLGPHEAIRLVSFLLSGAALPDDGEPEVDHADITAALTLIPLARGEMDALETGLLQMSRGRGMTWQEIAFGLGLGTPQAARQRYERLVGRTETTEANGPA
jgi:AcrR family transcriptional regulator